MSVANKIFRWLAVPVLALLMLLISPASPVHLSDADAAPRPVAADRGSSDVPGGRIKPYKYERAQRYTSESTRKPSTAPCSALPADPAAWPSGIASCYGPPRQQKQQPAPPPPAATARAVAPAANSSGSRTGGGSASVHSQQAAPSCR